VLDLENVLNLNFAFFSFFESKIPGPKPTNLFWGGGGRDLYNLFCKSDSFNIVDYFIIALKWPNFQTRVSKISPKFLYYIGSWCYKVCGKTDFIMLRMFYTRNDLAY